MQTVNIEQLFQNTSFLKDLGEGNFCLVLGAGFSCRVKNDTEKTAEYKKYKDSFSLPDNIPLAEQFRQLTNNIFEQNTTTYQSAANAWKKHRFQHNNTNLENYFRKLFTPDEEHFLNNHLNDFRSIFTPKWNNIYSLNFDLVLETILRQTNKVEDYEIVSYPVKSRGTMNLKPAIVHLHGTISTSDLQGLVFYSDTFAEHSHTDKTLYDPLHGDVSQKKKLIIIGTQFSEGIIDSRLYHGLKEGITIYHFDRVDDDLKNHPFINNNLNTYNFVQINEATDFLSFLKKKEREILGYRNCEKIIAGKSNIKINPSYPLGTINYNDAIPVYAGTYWGLNRMSYMGIYIDQLGDNNVIQELEYTEELLAKGITEIETRNANIKVRKWVSASAVGINNENIGDWCNNVKKDFNSTNSLLGIIIDFPVNNREQLEQFVKLLTIFIQRVNYHDESDKPAIIFNIGVERFSPLLNDIELLAKKIGELDINFDLTILKSSNQHATENTEEKRTSSVSSDTGQLLRDVLNPRVNLFRMLKDVYSWFLKPVGNGHKLEDLFKEFPAIGNLFKDPQFPDFVEKAEQKWPSSNEVVDSTYTFLAETDQKAQMHCIFEQLLKFTGKYHSKKDIQGFVKAYVRSKYKPAIRLALMFVLASGDSDIVKTWLQAVEHINGSPNYILSIDDNDRLCICVLRFINSVESGAIGEKYKQEVIDVFQKYFYAIHHGAFMADIVKFSKADPFDVPGKFRQKRNEFIEFVKRASPSELKKLSDTKLVEKYNLSFSEIADCLEYNKRKDNFRYYLRYLLFCKPVSTPMVSDLLSADRYFREILGLCSMNEIGEIINTQNTKRNIRKYRIISID